MRPRRQTGPFLCGVVSDGDVMDGLDVLKHVLTVIPPQADGPMNAYVAVHGPPGAGSPRRDMPAG